MQARIATIVLFLLASPASAQPYRCTVGDKTTYQQVPCDGGQKVNISGAGKAAPYSSASLQAKREINDFKRKERIEAAILEGKVLIGMTEEELTKSWGSPTQVNSTVSASGKRDQWVYRREGEVTKSKYVYVRNGVVTTIQSSE